MAKLVAPNIVSVEWTSIAGPGNSSAAEASELLTDLHLHNPLTVAHSLRVSELCVELGQKLGLSESACADLKLGGLLHDIGKLGVSPETLAKPGTLDPTEWEVMQKHPVWSLYLSGGLALSDQVMGMITFHHERFDGSGYPSQLRGDQIPLYARICALADVFDAMTTRTRDSNPALTTEAALERLVDQSGKAFDPELVNAFVDLFGPEASKAA